MFFILELLSFVICLLAASATLVPLSAEGQVGIQTSYMTLLLARMGNRRTRRYITTLDLRMGQDYMTAGNDEMEGVVTVVVLFACVFFFFCCLLLRHFAFLSGLVGWWV